MERADLWADQDPANLAAKIVRLLRDPDSAQVDGSNMDILLQQQRFSWEVVANAHLHAAGLQPKI